MNEKIEKVKNHIRENKKIYITGIVGFTGGIAIGTTIIILNKTKIDVDVDVDKFNIKWNSPTTNNIMTVVIEALGDPGNVVECLETGEIFRSQGEAARELGLNAAKISKYLNGKLPDVKGYTFKILGKAGHVPVE